MSDAEWDDLPPRRDSAEGAKRATRGPDTSRLSGHLRPVPFSRNVHPVATSRARSRKRGVESGRDRAAEANALAHSLSAFRTGAVFRRVFRTESYDSALEVARKRMRRKKMLGKVDGLWGFGP